jgi:hypothetical protein
MLKAVKGDKTNPILAANGYNMRKLLKHFLLSKISFGISQKILNLNQKYI